MSQNYAIILAGGVGDRCGGEISKQFQEINNIPIVIKTAVRFLERFDPGHLRIVINPAHKQKWKALRLEYPFIRDIPLVDGGEQRYHSVKKGLDSIPSDDDDLIGIHDGVRPFVALSTIDLAYSTARAYGTAVPVFDAVNTIRIASDETNNAIDRKYVKIVQNPQVFRSQILKSAYHQSYVPEMLDDGTIVEMAGYAIQLCKGNYENIKITHRQDLYIAEGLDKLLNTSD